MNRTIAAGVLGLAVIFAGSAKAADFDPNKSGGQGVTIWNGVNGKDDTVHIVIRRPLEGNIKGDSVFWIQKEKGSKDYLTTDGKKVFWGRKTTNWTFHKNSGDWSIMLYGNEALAYSAVKGGGVLERNQASPHQVWKIEKK